MAKVIDCLIIGGGASGFFFAANYAEQNPDHSVIILEKSKKVLQKVKISGGGRCNVTHAEFLPKELTTHYPRGERELIGPFHQFMTGDMMTWLENRGVELKVEDDGRIFPISDSSQTIIDCFMNEIRKWDVKVKTSQAVNRFKFVDDFWEINTKTDQFKAKKLVISTGSSVKIWNELARHGHNILPPTPSLFTFNIDDTNLNKLSGLSLSTHIKLHPSRKDLRTILESSGDTLITHWGLSGPCVLKLSAWGAQVLNELNYQCVISVNWLPDKSLEDLEKALKQQKLESAKKQVSKQNQFDLPKRFWSFIIGQSQINHTKIWADIRKTDIHNLAQNLYACRLDVNGKSTYKEEFVTAGGVDLKEIDFKTYNSKKLPQLKIIGEALNIDAITGGFNFQSAWTSAYIAAKRDQTFQNQ